MNIKIKAALYAIGWFVGMILFGVGLNYIVPYLEAWMGWAVAFGVLFYLVYSVILTQLRFDESITRVTNFPKDKNERSY